MDKSSIQQSSRAPQAVRTAAAKAILDVAEELAQTRGYNGFSYADIAAKLGVTTPSLHYHFPSKADLGCALIDRYQDIFGTALAAIDQQGRTPVDKLRQYAALYDSVMMNDRMCLCGMLAAEYATLPVAMQKGLKLFFDANERWLTVVLESGRRAGEFQFTESSNARARVLLGALEGAMLVARSYSDPMRFKVAAQYMLADLNIGNRPARKPVPARPISAARRSVVRKPAR
jgi:TetR/AcrR family transcriptional regulator, transcriptional repressor for nem operon